MINRLPESFATASPPETAVRDQALSEWDRELKHWYEAVEKTVVEHPGFCLTAAFFVGATLAWWIKRR